MPRRRVKIQFEDGDGGKYTIAIDGAITKDKITKVMDMVELLNPQHTDDLALGPTDTTFSKLYSMIERRFPFGRFTSNEVLEAYEEEYGQPVRLNTISTYLLRLVDRGLMVRERSYSGWAYRRVNLNTISR